VHEEIDQEKIRGREQLYDKMGLDITQFKPQIRLKEPTYSKNYGEITYKDSDAYRDFIDMLTQTMRDKMGDHYICLTCWTFLDLPQQNQH
jgi:hypothetical protein